VRLVEAAIPISATPVKSRAMWHLRNLEAAMPFVRPCEFRGVHAGVAVIVCPRKLSDAELRMIGRQACLGKQDCTAWFWDDRARAPEAPPTLERPMSEAQADAAVAIYIASLDRICRAEPDEQAA
jgi:hypothetical protein